MKQYTRAARHYAHPGPLAWDWRCMLCDHRVSDTSIHKPWWKVWGE